MKVFITCGRFESGTPIVDIYFDQDLAERYKASSGTGWANSGRIFTVEIPDDAFSPAPVKCEPLEVTEVQNG